MSHQFEIIVKTLMQDDSGICKYFAIVPDGEDDFLILFQSIEEGYKDRKVMAEQLRAEMIGIQHIWADFTTIH